MSDKEIEIENTVDEQWLDAIGTAWKRLTGECWETRDGETREEGVSHNIGALFAAFEERAEKAEAESRELSIQLEACRQHNATLREVGDQMLKDYQQTTLELERERKAAGEMRAALAECERELRFAPRHGQQQEHDLWGSAIKRAQAALSSDAGRDYHHRDEFVPLVGAVQLMRRVSWGDHAKQVAIKALAAARQKGIIP